MHRVGLRLSGGPLRPLWSLAYRLLARAWIAFLVRGEPNATAYLAGSLTGKDLTPGLSDVDVAVVLGNAPGNPGQAAQRTAARWTRLRRAFPAADLVLDYPLVLEADELAQTIGSSALTFELDTDDPGTVYQGARVSQDKLRMLERPGLYSTTGGWRHVRGPDRRPSEPPRDRQQLRIAAWLELCSWWQWVPGACLHPEGPRTASLCVKLVAEPVRIWLWLAHGHRCRTRADALTSALRLMPEEESALRRALALLRALPRSPEPPLEETLRATVRLSQHISSLIAAEIAEEGTTEVRLSAADPEEPILPHGRWRPTPGLADGAEPAILPLCDFRTLTHPGLLDACFARLEGELSDPTLIRLATASQEAGPHPALHTDELMVLPGARARTRMRTLKSPTSDPVSFALLAGRQVAAFPNAAGFSAHDLATRALAEHRAWLQVPMHGEDADGLELSKLLSAARTALFVQSIRNGTPELALTVSETVARLSEMPSARTLVEEAFDRYRDFAIYRTPPPADTLAAMREHVLALSAYAEPRPTVAAS